MRDEDIFYTPLNAKCGTKVVLKSGILFFLDEMLFFL